jgi:hypothetical protein
MVLLGAFTVGIFLVLPKSGGEDAFGAVFAAVAASMVLSAAAALFRGDLFGAKWVRRTSWGWYVFAAVCVVFGVTFQLVEPSIFFAYYPAFAGLVVGQLFRDERVERRSQGEDRRRLAYWGWGLCAAAVAFLGWAVFVIVAGGSPLLMNLLLLVSVPVLSGCFLVMARVYVSRGGDRYRGQVMPG